jgi:hypothetical protein
MMALGSKPVRKITFHGIFLGHLGMIYDLSILDIGISDIDLVRYWNGN